MKKRGLAFILTLCMVFLLLPATAFAEEGASQETITLAEFVSRVEKNGYQYDGQGVSVVWSPSSACTDTRPNHDCLFADGSANHPADGNNPNRAQNGNAQYSVFSGAADVSISNVNFRFVPADFTISQNSDATRKGSFSAADFKNAEIQMLNSGSVTFTGCTFDGVITSPFGSRTTSTFVRCTYQNVYNAYAIKDVYSANLTVTNCVFEHCSGGIYLEGSTAKNLISIENNKFYDMDTYAAAGKEYTRGLIQFSGSGDYSNARVTISGNISDGEAAVLRQLNDTVTAAVVDVDAVQANNQFAGPMFVEDSGLEDAGTVYVDTGTGIDTNEGTQGAPVKTIARAMELIRAGGTVLVSGTIGHNFFNGITKPVTIQGAGEEKVVVNGGVTLPEHVNGQVKFSNFSFNGTSTIGLYGTSQNYAGLDLVIENCAFTQAFGNCVYITPQINSLTVTGCAFTAPDGATYQKQYLIWPYAAKTITITGNTFDGKNVARAAIHLGDGHPEGTTATITGNTIQNFERGVQLAFTNSGARNQVTISENTFSNVALAPSTLSQPYEVGTVFIHESQADNTNVTYTGNELTGTSARIFYSENSTLTAEDLIGSFSGNTVNGTAVNTAGEGWHDAFVARVGDAGYKTLGEAITAAGTLSGDVVITLTGDVDLTDSFSTAAGAANTLSYDLSNTALTGLTIRGQEQTVQIISGVDGNDIDGNSGAPYCPKLAVKLPEDAALTVENLTVPNDLQFDSDGGTVVVQNCVFNGSISGYPQAGSVSYLNNTFTFKGTADHFYTHNAYPVWYKVNGGIQFTFDGNTVDGYRGVHIETRSSTETSKIQVNNNHFTLRDEDHENKTIALQLVNQFNGTVSFSNNHVDAYMAVCFFKDLAVCDGAQLQMENNDLTDGCKFYGSSEWNQDSIADSDTFAQSVIDALTGQEGSTVTPGHTQHNYVGGVCTICGQSQPSSGGSGTTSYGITAETAEHGTIAVSPKNASKGTLVTVTVTPDTGYRLDTLTVTDGTGKTLELTKKSESQYTFTMPASKVTVTAVFQAEKQESLPFTDVAEHAWYYEAVSYAYEKELIQGISGTVFAPDGSLTRGMMATLLYRMDGSPAAGSGAFTDVPDGTWYGAGVNWAAEHGIVNGYGDSRFGPEDNITREQMAAILYRYAAFKGYDVTAEAQLTGFADAAQVSDWAEKAMAWAVGAGLISGKDGARLDPLGTATRAEVAQILMNFCQNIVK